MNILYNNIFKNNWFHLLKRLNVVYHRFWRKILNSKIITYGTLHDTLSYYTVI